LVVAYYDEQAGKWIELPSTVDPVNNTIVGSVSHFTTFAIIGTHKPTAFTFTLLAISPAEVAPGETVTVTVSVANTGGTERSHTVVLQISGVKEAERTVTVAAGGRQVVSFSVTKQQPGEYKVFVGDVSGSFTVVAPAAFSISNLSIQPAQVKPGEAATVSVLVSNTGGKSGSYTVTLNINSVKEADKSVTIAAGGSQAVTFSVTRQEPGSYNVAIDGLSTSFIILAPTTTPPATSPTTPITPPVKPPFNWPLIGEIIGVAVVVGLVIFLVLRRKARA